MKLKNVRLLTAHLDGETEIYIKGLTNQFEPLTGLAEVDLEGNNVQAIILNSKSKKVNTIDKSICNAKKRKEILQKMFSILIDLKPGDKLSIKYNDSEWWEGIVTILNDETIDIVADEVSCAGYSCKNMIDLITCLVADFNEEILIDIEKMEII